MPLTQSDKVSPFTPVALLELIGEEKWLRRFHSLATIYKHKLEPKLPNTFLQHEVLLHAVKSHFCDLQHAKNFHNTPLADQHKVAAFTIKWIVKARPIQIRPDAKPTRYDLLANERFALMVALIFLKAPVKKISVPLLKNLLYTLHHRPFDAEALGALMYSIECALNRVDP